MKKLLLSLGALSAVVAPVAAVVACGSKTETPAKHDINVTTEATSTLTKADLAKVKVATDDTATSLQTKLGLNQTPMLATGATFVWDAKALTLTTTSTSSGVTSTQVITVTPKVTPVAKTKADAFDDVITKYQALNVMVATPSGKPETFIVAVPKNAGENYIYVDGEATVRAKTPRVDQSVLDTKAGFETWTKGVTQTDFLAKLDSIYADTLVSINEVLNFLEDAGLKTGIESVLSEIEKMDTGKEKYVIAISKINSALDNFVISKPEIGFEAHTSIESLKASTDITFKNISENDKDNAKQLIKIGLPLLLKLAKTHEAIAALV